MPHIRNLSDYRVINHPGLPETLLVLALTLHPGVPSVLDKPGWFAFYGGV